MFWNGIIRWKWSQFYSWSRRQWHRTNGYNDSRNCQTWICEYDSSSRLIPCESVYAIQRSSNEKSWCDCFDQLMTNWYHWQNLDLRVNYNTVDHEAAYDNIRSCVIQILQRSPLLVMHGILFDGTSGDRPLRYIGYNPAHTRLSEIYDLTTSKQTKKADSVRPPRPIRHRHGLMRERWRINFPHTNRTEWFCIS